MINLEPRSDAVVRGRLAITNVCVFDELFHQKKKNAALSIYPEVNYFKGVSVRSPQRSRSKWSGGGSSLFVPCGGGGGSKVAPTVRRGGCSVLRVQRSDSTNATFGKSAGIHYSCSAVRMGRGGGGGSGARSASGGSEFPASRCGSSSPDSRRRRWKTSGEKEGTRQ